MRTIICIVIGLFIVIGLPILIIIGLIKPTLIIPKKVNVKRPRLVIVITAIIAFVLGALLIGTLDPDPLPQIGKTEEKAVLNDSIIAASYSQKIETLYKTIYSTDSLNRYDLCYNLELLLKEWKNDMNSLDSSWQSLPLSKTAYQEAALKFVAVSDSSIAESYTQKFDTLLYQLIALDSQLNERTSRGTLVKKIEDLLFDKWWNAISIDDSLLPEFPISQKAYYDAQKRFDGPYSRYCVFGDGKMDEVEFWAKERARDILMKVCVDPESLVIEDVTCNGKTNNGYKCRVVYRAKNGFGGYVRESVTMTMAFDVNSSIYNCIEIH